MHKNPDVRKQYVLEYQRAWIARRRSAWIESQGGACVMCGSTDALEVDHVDPSTKLCNPTKIWSRNAAFRLAELSKCQVLCHDCHLDKTFTDTDRAHGTSYRYQEAGCRCAECRGWNASRMRTQRRRTDSSE